MKDDKGCTIKMIEISEFTQGIQNSVNVLGERVEL